MFDLVAFQRTAGGVGAEALTEQTPTPDQLYHIEGTTLYVGRRNKLLFVYAVGANIDDVQLQAPSLLRNTYCDVNPVDPNAEPQSKAPGMMLTENPLTLRETEGLKALSDCNAAAATVSTTIIALSDGPTTPARGEIVTLKAAAAMTTVAGVWNNFQLTLSQTLPVGRYSLVGAIAIGVTALAFRFVPVGGEHRPGGIAGDTFDAEGLPGQRFGGWGEWLEFDSQTPPSMEILTDGVDTVQDVFMDLIRL